MPKEQAIDLEHKLHSLIPLVELKLAPYLFALPHPDALTRMTARWYDPASDDGSAKIPRKGESWILQVIRQIRSGLPDPFVEQGLTGVAFATGSDLDLHGEQARGSEVIVFDVEAEHLDRFYAAIDRLGLRDRINETPTMRSSGAGRHVYFLDDPIHPIRSRNLYLDGVKIGDLKAHHGYICAYPSRGWEVLPAKRTPFRYVPTALLIATRQNPLVEDHVGAVQGQLSPLPYLRPVDPSGPAARSVYGFSPESTDELLQLVGADTLLDLAPLAQGQRALIKGRGVNRSDRILFAAIEALGLLGARVDHFEELLSQSRLQLRWQQQESIDRDIAQAVNKAAQEIGRSIEVEVTKAYFYPREQNLRYLSVMQLQFYEPGMPRTIEAHCARLGIPIVYGRAECNPPPVITYRLPVRHLDEGLTGEYQQFLAALALGDAKSRDIAARLERDPDLLPVLGLRLRVVLGSRLSERGNRVAFRILPVVV